MEIVIIADFSSLVAAGKAQVQIVKYMMAEFHLAALISGFPALCMLALSQEHLRRTETSLVI